MSITEIATYVVPSASADNTTLTTSGFTPANGEIIVVAATTWDASNGMAAPTDSLASQTFQHINTGPTSGFACWAGLWVCKISGSPGSMTISSAPATGSNTRHTMTVTRLGGADLAVSPATNSTTQVSGTTVSFTITTTASGSWIVWCLGEENSVNPANTSYITTSGTVTQDGIYDGHSGSNSVQYFAHQTTNATGSNTFGLTSASSMNAVAVGVEILATAGASVSSSDTATGSDTGTVTAAVTSSDTGTTTDSGTVVATLTSSDSSASVTESGSIAASTSSAETGTAVEGATVQPRSSDTGLATEGAVVGPVSADTAVATETAMVQVFDSDSAVAADSGTLTASQSSAEIAVASDIGTVSASISGTDTASATDTGALTAQITSSDSGTSNDAASPLQAALHAAETGTASDSQFVNTGSENVADFDTAHAVETEEVTIAQPKVKVYPYYIRETQPWAIEQERRRHNQALWYVGETTMFALMWHIEDFNNGLVGRCRSCYTSMGAITEVYGQSDQNKCLDCFGTTFDGGFKALIIRPAIFSDTDEGETFHSRGVIHPNDLAIESTPDFRVRNGDYCFRQTGERYYLRVPERITLRTGYSLPTQQDHAIGYNHANAAVEDPTAVAYLIPPPQDEVNTILRRASRIPRDWSSYEVIRAPLIPVNTQPPDA